jgi:putative AlgH/UPF0301 family transcriptional regulator
MVLKELNNNAARMKPFSNTLMIDPSILAEYANETVTVHNKIEPGVLLISHPMKIDMGFDRSVILICSHANQSLTGKASKKKKTVATIGLVVGHSQQEKSQTQPEKPKTIAIETKFGAIVITEDIFKKSEHYDQFHVSKLQTENIKTLHVGGPVKGVSAIFKQAERPDLIPIYSEMAPPQEVENFENTEKMISKGIVPIGQDYFWGKGQTVIQSIDSLIKEGKVKERDTVLYSGSVSWAATKLREQIDNGMYIMVKCSRNFILDFAKRPDVSENDVWNLVMSKLGGEYAHWTNFPKDTIKI